MVRLLFVIVCIFPAISLAQSLGQVTPENLDWDGDGDLDFRVDYSSQGLIWFDIVDLSTNVQDPANRITTYVGDTDCATSYVEVYSEDSVVLGVFWGFASGGGCAPEINILWSAMEPSDFIGGSIGLGSGTPVIVAPIVVNGISDIFAAAAIWRETFRPRPGSLDDLVLLTGVNAAASDFPRIKECNQGDPIVIEMNSPDGDFNFETVVLAVQVFPTGAPNPQPSGFPEAWLNPSPFASSPVVILINGPTAPFGPSVLPPSGVSIGATVPLFLSGFSIMIQGFVLAPSAVTGNPFFVATDGHELRVL